MRPSNRAARLLPRGLSIARMPAQFHLLVGGSLLSSAGYTLSFPFLTIYLSTVLGIPMDRVGLVFTGNALAGFLAQGIAGPVADQVGRKPVMVGGLLGQGLVALAFTQAQSFEQFALLGFLNGFFGSMYFPASNAMVVDLVGEEDRAEAFSYMRVAINLGWVIGPTTGGLLSGVVSYTGLFFATALAELSFMLLLVVLARETIPRRVDRFRLTLGGGYGQVLRNGSFLLLMAASTLASMLATQLTTTMPVFLRQEGGLPDSGYGLLMAVNAGMVVLFQIPMTRLVERRNRGAMLALGAIFSAVGFGSLGWWSGFQLFLVSQVILTIGEIIVVPVASAAVADLSTLETRARYMAAYGLTWTIGFGLGPALGGVILERWGSFWLWNSMLALGCLAALAYLPLGRRLARATGS